MKPTFRIIADEVNITDLISQRLISLNITDETGLVSDKAEILLDNRDSLLEIPVTGAILKISMGYEGKELNLMGSYIVDAIELACPPLKMRIIAKATNTKIKNLNSKIRSPKSKSWHKHTLVGIITTIAKDHKFEALIDKQLNEIYIKHIDQSDESDISFLTNLAREHDSFIKFIDGKLIFAKKGTGTSISGIELPKIEIYESEISSWSLNISERGKFGRVRAKWHNLGTGKEEVISFGSEEPTYSARYVFASQDRAKQIAKSKLAEFQRGIKKLNLSMSGNQHLSAESKIIFADIKYLKNKNWIITSVNHSLNDQGYKTGLNAIIKISDVE